MTQALKTIQTKSAIFTCYENDWIIKEIEKYGRFSAPEIQMISDILKNGDVVIDVGAHIGTFSIPIKQKIGDTGKVVAFEANPETFDILKQNVESNHLDIKMYNKGVSDKNGTLYLQTKRYVASDDKPLNSGADYLTSEKKDNDEKIEIPLVKLDDVINGNVHFIKVDVEGMECSVFRSAERIIDRYKPVIYSEFFPYYLNRAGDSSKVFSEFFKNRGYHFFINMEPRSNETGEYKLVKLPGVSFVRNQVDFLLIHKDSDRYPKIYNDWKMYKPHLFIWNRLLNFKNSLKNMIYKFYK